MPEAIFAEIARLETGSPKTVTEDRIAAEFVPFFHNHPVLEYVYGETAWNDCRSDSLVNLHGHRKSTRTMFENPIQHLSR